MKIPFERTISGAYRFAFTNILSIFGIGWFPILLLGLMVAAVIYQFGPAFLDALQLSSGKPPGPEKMLPFFQMIVAVYALLVPGFVLVRSMITVGVQRKALGQHPGPVFFFFSLGSQVWRLIGSYFLVLLLSIGAGIVLGGSIGVIWALLDKFLQPAAAPVAVLLGITAFCWFIYAYVRLSFFLPAIVVAENHIGLRRSWHLGGGNFWRIVGIVLVMILPIAFATQAIEGSLLQILIGTMGPLPQATPGDPKEFIHSVFMLLARVAPYYGVVQLIYLALSTGLMNGAVANAYNLVTGGQDIAPPPPPLPAKVAA